MAGFSRGDAFNLSSYLRPRLLLLALLSLLMIYLLLATILNFLPEPALHASEPSSSFRITLPFTPPEMPPKRPVSNTNLGDPLFDTPNSKFDKAVQLLKNTSHIPPSPSVSSKYDRFAVALKTGADVAVERASVQLVTFLSKIKKLAVIGEAPGVHVGTHPMIDVFTGVYDMVDRRLSAMEKKRKLEFTKQKGGPMVDETQRHNRRSLHRRKEDAVIPAESSLGWKLDAHKNLPGFEYLYKTYPDADWYIMIDDDSYVFFDNLERYLRDMDPAVPFYTGSANVFLGCDGVTKFGEGPGFAHGGSGIVVSRGAMKLMMEGIEKCIKKYKDCWAGDVRVALCLRDQNLLITPGVGFIKEPPNDKYQFPANGCERPNVFHHLLPYQIQRLYEIELTSLSTHPDQGTTMSDIHNTFNPSTHNTPSLNTDRTGNDFDDGPASSVAICEGRCFAHVRCVSWAYNGERCWMKDGLGVKIEKEGIVSGVIADRYSCKK